MITSFLVIFFFVADIGQYSAKKKILTNKRSYSSNGNTYMPMIWRFYATPIPLKIPQKITFLKIPHKMRPYQAIFNWSLFNFFFSTEQESYFFFTTLDFFFILKFKNHDFVNKKRGRWYKFLIVIFFSKKLIFKICLLGNNLRKKNINI